MNNQLKFLLAMTGGLALLLWTPGCDLLTDDSEEGMGTLSVLVTDEPFPADFLASAIIMIDSLDVRQKGTQSDSGAYITLSRERTTYDLMDLRNGITATLTELDIPEGIYNQVRLFVDSAKVVLTNGAEYPLKVPSGAQTGLKVFIRPDIEVAGGIVSELLLDFDVSKSFVAKGNLDGPHTITGFNFHPVLRAVNLATAGRLRGTVTNDSSDAPIYAAQLSISTPDSVLSTTFTDTLGAYAFIGIPVGTYAVEAAKAGYVTETETGVAVDAQGTTIQNFSLTPE